MLNDLKFVMGAVSKKDFLPALTHFRIEGGTVRSFNGTLALCTPIQLSLECTPKAVPLVKAIQNCDETVSLSLTPTGKLSVKSGKFRSLIECVSTETPHVLPEGDIFPIDGTALLDALKSLQPFIGDDASRPWANGILLKGASAYATNNVILAEFWTGNNFPITCNVPRMAIREMLRIGEPPISAQATENSITFHYEGSKWIRTALYDLGWPDLDKVLNRSSNPEPINEEMFAALEKIAPFADVMGRVFFQEGSLTTHPQQTEGAHYELTGFPHDGVYQISMLALLQGTAKSIDFSTYPSPCLWFGDNIRGAIIGMRK